MPDETTTEDLIQKVSERTEVRSQLSKDRRDGVKPVAISTVGSLTVFEGTTGIIANGSSSVIYLTWNQEAGGDSVFGEAPWFWNVLEDASGTGGGMERVTGPITPSASYSLRNRNDFDAELSWKGQSDKIYAITVTNNTGSSCDFAVFAAGFS